MAKIHLNSFKYEANEKPVSRPGRTYCASGSGKGETLSLTEFNKMRKTDKISNMCTKCLSRSEKTGLGIINTGQIKYHPS